MIELWDIQHEMVAGIREKFRERYRAPLLVSPTGSGKTVMFCYMAQNHVQKGGRVLILTHRNELLDQITDTLANFNIKHGFIAARRESKLHDVMAASVFSLSRRLGKLFWTPTLIIVDEAHHCVDATTFGSVLKAFPDARVLGVTATPIRLSGEGLEESFDCMVQGPTPANLIERGYLSPFRFFIPPGPDMSQVHRRGGEYIAKEVEADPLRPRLIGDAVKHYTRIVPGRLAVAFCVSVDDAWLTAQRFRDAGYSAASIDGRLLPNERRQMVRDFKSRQLQIMTSCSLIDEGFDCPAIEVDIDLAPTSSLGRHLQRRGRGLRRATGKEELVILDAANNILRHGLPTDPRDWSLSGCKSATGDKPKPVRVCRKCWAGNAVHRRNCIGCGHLFEVTPRSVPQADGDLIEGTPEQIEARRYKETAEDKKSLEFLTKLARRRGYKNPEGWAKHVVAGVRAKKARKVKAIST